MFWEPPILGSSTPYQHEEPRTDILPFKHEHTPSVSEPDTEVLEIDLRRKYARLLAHRDESVSSIHIPVSQVSRPMHLGDLLVSPMQKDYSTICTTVKESPTYYETNSSNIFVENRGIDTTNYSTNYEPSFLQSKSPKDFETAKSANNSTKENEFKIDEFIRRQKLPYPVAFPAMADTYPSLTNRLAAVPGYISERKNSCSVDFNNNVPALISTMIDSASVPAAEVIDEPGTVEDAIKSLGFQDSNCKSQESKKEECNFVLDVEKSKLEESEKHTYSDVSEEEPEEIERLRKATVTDAADTDSPNETTFAQYFPSPNGTQYDDFKDGPHVKKKDRRKMSAPRRSAPKKDPKFRGVTMWLQTKFKDGQSELQISAFYR